jgi:probable F420-dependent oxidoreductase
MSTIATGVILFATHEAMDPAAVAALVEDHGHQSVFFPEHTHIPAARETAYPWGGELHRKYCHTYDPFVALMAAAAATRTLRLGTGICLVPERDPIVTAKEVATLDVLSGGRFEFGIGAGWNREEMANHGTDPKTRFALMAERVRAMKAIWTDDEASFNGDFVSFQDIWSWPKPTQRPHPPILVGGGGATVIDRVLAYGDGWLPLHEDDVLGRVGDLRRRAEDAGREITVSVLGVPPEANVIDAYLEAGIERVIFWLPTARRSSIEKELHVIEAALVELYGT